MKCYNGTIGDLELVECPTKPIDRLGVIDSCINVTSEKGNFYTCSRKAAIEADTKIQMEDNQCRTSNVRFLGMTEVCICDTDGCNYEVRNRSLPRESTGNPINYLIYSEILPLINRLNFWVFILGCCDRLILTSTGNTLDYNSAVLGTYKAVGVSYGRSHYKNEKDNDFHLHFNSDNTWLVCTLYCT